MGHVSAAHGEGNAHLAQRVAGAGGVST
jgi:hypothetical protein